MVVDPFAVLKEGEIHFTSSKNLQDSLEAVDPKTITGDVLVSFHSLGQLASELSCVVALSKSCAPAIGYPQGALHIYI